MILEMDYADLAFGTFGFLACIGAFVVALRKLREERRVEHEGVVYAMRRNGRIEDPDGRIVEDPLLRAALIAKGASFGWTWVFPTEGYEPLPGGGYRPRVNWQGGGGHEPPGVIRHNDDHPGHGHRGWH